MFMDNFLLKLALFGTALSLYPWLIQAQEDDVSQMITLELDNTSIDLQSDKVIVQGLRISQGNWRIEADEALATGLDFDRSEWQLNGNVRFAIDSAVISAEAAAFTFEGNQLIKGDLSGNPASFEDLEPEGQGPIRGGANRLYYNNIDATVRLADGASLTLGPNAVSGCDLIYNINEERVVSGTSECGEPFRIIIAPDEETPKTASSPP